MTIHANRAIALTALVLVLASSLTVAGQDASHRPTHPDTPGPGPSAVPPVPAGLEVPDGHRLFLATRAAGTQNYICLSTGAAIAWRFLGPQATLYLPAPDALRRPHPLDPTPAFRHQVATHFLSANPAEPGLARPTWQHSSDSSRVWARVVASSADAAYVEPGAIAWLLLEAAGTEAGAIGGASLARTTFIQRLNTSGGAAPATGCSGSGDVGTLALVPYTTDYFFYAADAHPGVR